MASSVRGSSSAVFTDYHLKRIPSLLGLQGRAPLVMDSEQRKVYAARLVEKYKDTPQIMTYVPIVTGLLQKTHGCGRMCHDGHLDWVKEITGYIAKGLFEDALVCEHWLEGSEGYIEVAKRLRENRLTYIQSDRSLNQSRINAIASDMCKKIYDEASVAGYESLKEITQEKVNVQNLAFFVEQIFRISLTYPSIQNDIHKIQEVAITVSRELFKKMDLGNCEHVKNLLSHIIQGITFIANDFEPFPESSESCSIM